MTSDPKQSGADDGKSHPTDHTHEEINGYCATYIFRAPKTLGNDEVKDFARKLMEAIAAANLRHGATDVGHIKAHLEFGGEGFLYADTLGDVSDIMVRGRDGSPTDTIKLVINSIIVELEAPEIRDATEQGVDEVCGKLGFTKEILKQDLYDADDHEHLLQIPDIDDL
jgi:hypothetical protein